VIIFGSIQFLPIKTTKPKFYKIQKIKPKPVPTDRFRFSSVILHQKSKPKRLVSVLFGLVRFDYFILKTKKYIFFGICLDFLIGFGFSLIRFSVQLRFFDFKLMKPKLNLTKYFLNILIGLISFFSWFSFFGVFVFGFLGLLVFLPLLEKACFVRLTFVFLTKRTY